MLLTSFLKGWVWVAPKNRPKKKHDLALFDHQCLDMSVELLCILLQDQLGDVLHWIRQAVALVCGLIWGAIPLVGGIWLIL